MSKKAEDEAQPFLEEIVAAAEAEDLFGESEYALPREDGREGPPDSWAPPSWFNRKNRTWWYRQKGLWALDPCPVRALGAAGGQYIFVTAFGELRSFTSAALHGRGGLPDIFGGQFGWPLRHFRKFDHELKVLKGELQRDKCIAFLMREAEATGFFDGSKPHRSVGTWRGPEGEPIVHAGDRIFWGGQVLEPGVEIGEALFVIGGKREAPRHEIFGTQPRWSAPLNRYHSES